ncbi:hypothetical protein ACIQCV_00080 [Dietzia maris]|uniref:hypothetical protein n=1 Tax=Dietzia sp. SL131 TaxID=2995149 RepID=UPI00227C7187|nr:hypothetical protein [Dietzia sp. SL131]MCY1657478.1 hypothetical protein [Dietzia sp. SL131]
MAPNANNSGSDDVQTVKQLPAPRPNTTGPQKSEYSPMLVLVGVLLVTGVAGTGVIVFGALCVAMMGLMMFAMPGGHGH